MPKINTETKIGWTFEPPKEFSFELALLGLLNALGLNRLNSPKTEVIGPEQVRQEKKAP